MIRKPSPKLDYVVGARVTWAETFTRLPHWLAMKMRIIKVYPDNLLDVVVLKRGEGSCYPDGYVFHQHPMSWFRLIPNDS